MREKAIIFKKNESVSHFIDRALNSKIVQINLLSLGLGRKVKDKDIENFLNK